MSEVSIDTIDDLQKFELLSKLQEKFKTAEEKGDLIFSEPKVEIVKDEEEKMVYEVKIVTGLGLRPINRPTAPGTSEVKTDKSVEEVKKKNPFMNPEPELTIVDKLLNNYRLILNKFPNAPYHFLMVTREFVPQDSLLKPIELTLIYNILKKVNSTEQSNNDNKNKFFAFFNSGPESGYSQFHKHIQIMSIDKEFPLFPDSVVKDIEWFMPNDNKNSRQALFNSNLKFKHYILPLPKKFKDNEECEEILSMMYMSLFKQVLNISKELEIPLDKLSYNFLMTENWIMIIPRRAAFYKEIWQNSLGFLGLFNAKNEEIVSLMHKYGFGNILKECGIPLEKDEEKIVYNEYGY